MTDSTPNWVRTAKAGDKVVCIQKAKSSNLLSVGTVYTICGFYSGLSVDVATRQRREVKDRVDILEVPLNPNNGAKLYFKHEYFRPLITTKSTSKAIAKLRLLLDSKVSDEVSA